MSTINVAIIDYQLCNLFSVNNACKFVGINSTITTSKDDVLSADAVILPGVGAFGDAMDHLKELDLVEPIHRVIEDGKPFMGICLGLQLLFEGSEEFGHFEGLGIVSGKVKKFPSQSGDKSVKVPQIAWNTINIVDNKNGAALNGIRQNEFMYFVHSYYVEPANDEIILTKTRYEDIEYCSSIHKENLWAFQFHPEKSGPEGLKIYQNWKDLIISG